MDLPQIRRLIVAALFSDDELLDLLVLKGGNALQLVHVIVDRASTDLDFSMAADCAGSENASVRLLAALRRHVQEAGLVVFDESFIAKREFSPCAKSRIRTETRIVGSSGPFGGDHEKRYAIEAAG